MDNSEMKKRRFTPREVHPASFRRGIALLMFLASIAGGEAKLRAAQAFALPAWSEDAQLTDVVFIDPDRGWAIGDQGVIWRTEDGGRQWRLVNSPVSCRLESISFSDPQNGWIVGGWFHPYTHQSTGVVLRTRDGGRTWKRARVTGLPYLKRIKMFDARHGWAVGQRSALYPSGIFHTDDGGLAWSSTPAAGNASWQDIAFPTPEYGVALAVSGALAVAHKHRLERSPALGANAKYARRIRVDRTGQGWIVGDQGFLQQSNDGGAHWRAAVPPAAASQFDFRAIATLPGRCWIAGTPGSRVFHSADSGRTWEVFETGAAMPLRALFFLDSERGWAVGDMGAILATRDGGRTWRKQRAGGERCAMLGFFSRGESAPLELLAQAAGNEGYLTVVEFLNQEHPAGLPHQTAGRQQRTRQALARLGVSAASYDLRSPVRRVDLLWPKAAILEGWRQAGGPAPLARLEEHIVAKIRLWRPAVIVTEAAGGANDGALASLINQAVLNAAARAADPRAYPQQMVFAGLQPWKPARVFSVTADTSRGSVKILSAQLAHRFGESLGAVTAGSRGLLPESSWVGPTRLSLHQLVGGNSAAASGRSLFGGLGVAAGGDIRRRQPQPTAGKLEQMQQLAQLRRNIEGILAHEMGGSASGAWLAQFEQWSRSLTPQAAGDVLFQLANRERQRGKTRSAFDAFHLLVSRYPQHNAAEAALLWMIQSGASAEVRHRNRLPQAEAVAELAAPNVALAGFGQTIAAPADARIQRTEFQLARRPRKAASSIGSAYARAPLDQLAKRASLTHPVLYSDPVLRFPWAAHLRARGAPREAMAFYNMLSKRQREDGWAKCAAAELWLASPNGNCPKPLWRCKQARTKPRLDGVLDDDIWKTAQRVLLKSDFYDDDAWPADAALAFDDKFLYLAVSCRRAEQADYSQAPARSRKYDADLANADRIRLRIDIDRDFTSFYELTIDYRGRTADRCFGDKTWNPRWYVAVHHNGLRRWTVEAAIPFSELTAERPLPGDVWAVNLDRAVPKVGWQAWTRPLAPRHFGYLQFSLSK